MSSATAALQHRVGLSRPARAAEAAGNSLTSTITRQEIAVRGQLRRGARLPFVARAAVRALMRSLIQA